MVDETRLARRHSRRKAAQTSHYCHRLSCRLCRKLAVGNAGSHGPRCTCHGFIATHAAGTRRPSVLDGPRWPSLGLVGPRCSSLVLVAAGSRRRTVSSWAPQASTRVIVGRGKDCAPRPRCVRDRGEPPSDVLGLVEYRDETDDSQNIVPRIARHLDTAIVDVPQLFSANQVPAYDGKLSRSEGGEGCIDRLIESTILSKVTQNRTKLG